MRVSRVGNECQMIGGRRVSGCHAGRVCRLCPEPRSSHVLIGCKEPPDSTGLWSVVSAMWLLCDERSKQTPTRLRRCIDRLVHSTHMYYRIASVGVPTPARQLYASVPVLPVLRAYARLYQACAHWTRPHSTYFRFRPFFHNSTIFMNDCVVHWHPTRLTTHDSGRPLLYRPYRHFYLL